MLDGSMLAYMAVEDADWKLFFISEYLKESMSQKLKFSATDFFPCSRTTQSRFSSCETSKLCVAIAENSFAHYGKHQNQDQK